MGRHVDFLFAQIKRNALIVSVNRRIKYSCSRPVVNVFISIFVRRIGVRQLPASVPRSKRDANGAGRSADPEGLHAGEGGEVFRGHRAVGREATLQNQMHRRTMGRAVVREPAR